MSIVHSRIALLTVSSLVVLVGSVVPTLAARTVKIDSIVTLSENQPAFHGRVKSSKHACEQQRTVKLLKRRPGLDEFLGKDRSDSHGRWKVVVDPLTPGGYYAKLVRRREGTAGTIFVCRGDRSIVATIVPH